MIALEVCGEAFRQEISSFFGWREANWVVASVAGYYSYFSLLPRQERVACPAAPPQTAKSNQTNLTVLGRALLHGMLL